MRKAEAEALRATIRDLERRNAALERTVFYVSRDAAETRCALLKARALLGRWMSERHDRERYPVGTTRLFLKAWWVS